ncbi:MAG: Nramp family divalent metal transporter [Eubacteriales bacterium]|nr:Nramp family divalent metal transporter [Eubacteriales bacterium]
MKNFITRNLFSGKHERGYSALDILKFIGPGLLVTVGFIDPGNWAANVAAGATFGYSLLWMVTLGTIMLIFLQHNAAHLGIATGYCISESATLYLKPWVSRLVLSTAIFATVATVFAELLGGAIALNLLFNLPISLGVILVAAFSLWLLISNSYRKLERWIIGFVSLIGISFIFEMSLIAVDWPHAATSMVLPRFPANSLLIIMSVLGAVVMPHNLFLHSEIIQSRQWNLKDESIMNRQLKYEFTDTLLSMGIGWAINSSMIILAAATFFARHIEVTELGQAQQMLTPLLGKGASLIFAVALLLAGVASSVTAGMAGGSIFAGMFNEPYNVEDRHSKVGVIVVFILATIAVLLTGNPFQGLVYSQMLLSVQLPITIFLQIYLTSSQKIMGKYANSLGDKITLITIGLIVSALNIALLWNTIAPN